MYAQVTALKSLSTLQLKAEENTMLKWLCSATWEEVKGPHNTVNYKAKIPEFFGGIRLYTVSGSPQGSSVGGLELFIKKLGIQGVISKQALYPIEGHGAQPRYLSLKKADLDNLGIGREENEE